MLIVKNIHRLMLQKRSASIALIATLLSLSACSATLHSKKPDAAQDNVSIQADFNTEASANGSIRYPDPSVAAPPPSIIASQDVNPLLADLSARDLARVQAEAKRMYAKHWKNVSERSRYVRARVLPIIEQMHAPKQLQVVPVAESGYNPYAFSSAGATGLWQVMPGTARVLGMKAPAGYDSRRHVESSTRGGVQYLLDMHAIFGNWPTAFAAYHRGPGSMKKRLRRHPWQPKDGLDHMPVPLVTRTYVRGILGLSILLQRNVWKFPEAWETHKVTLDGPLDVNLLAKAAGISRNEIYRFNPGLNHSQYLKHQVTLHVPESMIEPLLSSVGQAAPSYVLTRVRRGDSLWRLAHRHHTSVHDLKRINPGIGKLLHPGQHINVPSRGLNSAHPPLNPLLAQGRRIHYRVRSGDSLWRIAKRFGSTPAAIARANSIRRSKTLHPGDRLWVLARARPS